MTTSPSRSTAAPDQAAVDRFAADVRYYIELSPRQLSSRYLYDELGSALFEAICHLPWYTITRAEGRLLDAHAAEILGAVPALRTIIELGPGTGEKLELLLSNGRASPPQPAGRLAGGAVAVHLVDLSPRALSLSARLIGRLPDVAVATHLAAYDEGLRAAARESEGRRLVAFLGSNVGNFDPPGAAAFLRNVRADLAPGDALLLGVDLVKPAPALLMAYDDPLGVTAAFNRNLLLRVNRELGGNFDLGQFRHHVEWNAGDSRIELQLIARAAQHIRIGRAEVEFRMERDEPIWTESSYKFRLDEAATLLESAALAVIGRWIDAQDRFALLLAEAR
jgi:dimethylhistidine N-methyltransferase